MTITEKQAERSAAREQSFDIWMVELAELRAKAETPSQVTIWFLRQTLLMFRVNGVTREKLHTIIDIGWTAIEEEARLSKVMQSSQDQPPADQIQ